MDHIFVTTGFVTLVIVYSVYRWYTRTISLADVPGPKSASFIMGNMKELYQGQAAEADFKWQAQYGNVVRFKALFGEDQLMISDPAALQYIFVRSGYRFPKLQDRSALGKLVNGRGILWAEGDNHKRHRRVMLPGFGAPESKAFLPLFKGCAESMSDKWMDIINNSEEWSVEFNIPAWLSRATLDAIGEAAFDVRFGSIDNSENALAHAYGSMVADAFGSPSDGQVFIQGVSKYIPTRILEYLGETTKNPRITRLRETGKIATSVAKEMAKDKAEMLMQGKGSRDVFSLLIKANMDADAKSKLTEEEMYAQMRTILFAGHETTSNTVTWALLELARHPEIQSRLRMEIRETEATIHARGDVISHTTMGHIFVTASFATLVIVYRVYRWYSRISLADVPGPKSASFIMVQSFLAIVQGLRGVCNNSEEQSAEFNISSWLSRATLDAIGEEACLSIMAPTLEGEVENGVQMTLRVSVAPRTEKEY
ncbi:cytochrome P450 [Rhizopogon salebrosus TDB-379]|nr:cytochrome P450 [Rhizopogon salebrosus TDB-379]